MADDEVITEQIRALTLTDRYRTSDEGDVRLPALDTRLLSAAGDEPACETIVIDEMDLMATDEFLQLARSAERLDSSEQSIIATSKLRQLLDPDAEPRGGANPLHDTTITELPPFDNRDGDSG